MLLMIVGIILFISTFQAIHPKNELAQKAYRALYGGNGKRNIRIFASLCIIWGIVQLVVIGSVL